MLGLSVLAGCSHESMPEQSQDALQVTSGPVNVAMTLSIKGFGQDKTLTKGDFYEQGNDFVEVNDTLFYDHEKFIKDAGIFVFDAENAFGPGSGGKYEFKPGSATFVGAVKPEYMDVRDTLTRVQFKLDKPYKSLAVLILANYHLASYSASGAYMQDVVENLSAQALSYEPNQNEYFTNGIPMHGWKVFGSLEGLSSSLSLDSDAAKKRRLRYYKGMTTPLTVVGFEDPVRLEEYAKEGTGKGVVNKEDHVQMEFALSRLQLRYVPKPKAIQADSVVLKSVKLNVYKNKFRMVSQDWLDWSDPANRPNPYTYTAYDSSTEVGDFVSSDVDFKKIDSKTRKSTAFVAYVPEILAPDVKNAIDNVTGFKEPSLKVEVEVTFRPKEKPYGPLYDKATYIYERNKITVKYGSEEKEYENYGDEGWLSWLKFRTIQEREDIGGSPVTIGTRYSLVRHYSYEWVAVGINE